MTQQKTDCQDLKIQCLEQTFQTTTMKQELTGFRAHIRHPNPPANMTATDFRRI